MPTTLIGNANSTYELLVEDLRLSSLSSSSLSLPSVFPVLSYRVYENSGASLVLTILFGCVCGCCFTCGLGLEDL
jgi:hypothetical protein